MNRRFCFFLLLMILFIGSVSAQQNALRTLPAAIGTKLPAAAVRAGEKLSAVSLQVQYALRAAGTTGLPKGRVPRLHKRTPLLRPTTRTAIQKLPSRNGPKSVAGPALDPNLLGKAVQNSFRDVADFWGKTFGDPSEQPLFEAVFYPTLSNTFSSLHNNRMLLACLRNLAANLAWLRTRKALLRHSLQTEKSAPAWETLTTQLAQEKLIFIGEIHNYPAVQHAVGDLITLLTLQAPQRRVVVFTEFLDLPSWNPAPRDTRATYYRRIVPQEILPKSPANDDKFLQYAPQLFLQLKKLGVDIYPLEDTVQQQVLARESGLDEDLSLLTLTQRNKTWARVLESKMAEIRRTDPDALFVVYGGLGHTSWLMPASLPKFFANEHPAVVEITPNQPSAFSALHLLWGAYDEFFHFRGVHTLHYWAGPQRRELAKRVGFDYAFIVPGSGT